ncbi:MAG: S1 RNA-binding domain-containing protein [Deltaproteobacteria bacterium]|nr:S1 RNA-binding domain-containing protein [Deltaproteobacteria bacterium]
MRAVVLSIDKENERFSLGIKQLEKDPWDEISERFDKGQNVTGTITNVTSFGIFIELGEGIEGLIHVSELGDDVKMENCKSGDELSAVITNIDKKGRKVSLSVKEIKESEEKEGVKEYMGSQEEATTSLGEELKEKFEEKKETKEGNGEGSGLQSLGTEVQSTEETVVELKDENGSTEGKEHLTTDSASGDEEEIVLGEKKEVEEGSEERSGLQSLETEAQSTEEAGVGMQGENESAERNENLPAGEVSENEKKGEE